MRMPRVARLAHQRVQVVQRPEGGVDVAVVRDVVAPVAVGRAGDRREPDAGDAEPRQVVQLDRCRAGRRRRPRWSRRTTGVDLVEDAAVPPAVGITFRAGWRHGPPLRGRGSRTGAYRPPPPLPPPKAPGLRGASVSGPPPLPSAPLLRAGPGRPAPLPLKVTSCTSAPSDEVDLRARDHQQPAVGDRDGDGEPGEVIGGRTPAGSAVRVDGPPTVVPLPAFCCMASTAASRRPPSSCSRPSARFGPWRRNSAWATDAEGNTDTLSSTAYTLSALVKSGLSTFVGANAATPWRHPRCSRPSSRTRA